jgi:hypothetical protein
VVGNKNAHPVKQFVGNNDIGLFIYLDSKAFNALYGAVFQPFFNNKRVHYTAYQNQATYAQIN